MFETPHLEDVQTELLMFLVEASRNVSRERRQKFLVVQDHSSRLASIIHPGLPKDYPGGYIGDIDTLANQGFLNITNRNSGSISFDLLPLSFEYYEYIRKQQGESIKRVEITMSSYLNSQYFQTKYPDVFEKWSESEKMLWKSKTNKQYTIIGHLCRESQQLYASRLIDIIKPENYDNNPAHTIARIRSILSHHQDHFGKDEMAFCDALLSYWGAVNDLIQRQEHGAQKEGKPLSWEDGRRVVFHTMIVMYEIDKFLFNKT
jgi:hypothetical protein